MQFILTTATAVQKIKLAAKAIASNSEISHTKALEQAAQEAGYKDWFHVRHCHKARDESGERPEPIPLSEQVKRYSQYLSTLSRAPVNVHKIKGPVFHEVSIEGHRFKARVLLTGDIVIHKMHPLAMIEESGVNIGVASIRRCDPRKTKTESEWWVCKYDSNEPRVDIGQMTEQGRNALAYEFGLPIIPKEGLSDPKSIWSTFVYGREGDLFYLSPAFIRLVEWAKNHLRAARSSSKNSNYLRQWMSVAVENKLIMVDQTKSEIPQL